MAFLFKVRVFLDLKSKGKVFVLLFFIILGALGEFLGIVSLFPFISIVSNPSIIQTNKWMNLVYTYLEFKNSNDFFIFLGIVFLICLYIRVALVTLSKWYLTKYSEYCSYLVSYKMLSRYTYQPYSFYFQRNISDLVKNVTTEASFVVKNVIYPVLNIVSNFLNSVFVLAFIFYISPGTAIVITSLLVLIYLIVYYFIKKVLTKIGRKRLSTTREKFKIVDQILSSIKELKILRRESFFIDKFTKVSYEYAQTQVKSVLISEASSDIMESLIFTAIISVVLWFFITRGNLDTILPLLSLYGLTIYRLMPIFQIMFSSLARIRLNTPTMDYIYQDLMLENTEKRYPLEEGTVPFNKSIRLENITYTYPGKSSPAVSGASIEMAAGSIVGFTGVTGSGKTTLIDVILGILTADTGNVFIDGITMTKNNIKNWQSVIGYVPQNICLLDDTIKNNIALGVDKINQKSVENAVKIADLQDFIETKLPNKYDTEIGDKGVCLSGGQKQRVGIARALYKNPRVLVLDEATSNLDGVTEHKIIESVKKMPDKKTILMITHRLETLKTCDVVYLLDGGRIVDSGTYDSLVSSSILFKHMVENKESYEKE